MSSLRIAFAGTPELAAVVLNCLLQNSLDTVACVYTQPDRPAGRGRKLTPSSVKLLAETHSIPIYQPAKPEQLNVEHFKQVDLLIVAAYGMILPEEILNAPKYGAINVHTSLLPRWRGAAPIQRAIEAGDLETGITIMQMDAGLDTGDILLQKSCPISGKDTAAILHDRLALLGAECLEEALDLIKQNKLNPTKQDNFKATYAKKITKAEAEINWHDSAIQIERKVRAFNPMPVSYTTIHGQAMRVWQATVFTTDHNNDIAPGEIVAHSPEGLDISTQDGILRILTLQLPGKKKITCQEFYNANPDFKNR